MDLREDGKPPLTEALAQPKRVALLAYLAVHGGGYVRRDTLLALLWPELDTDRARHSLRQALYLLRRWLKTEIIVKRGEEELAIRPELLWCDAVAFEELIKEGRAEDALALYGGDFLAGFHVPEASEEFEDWIVRVRQERRAMALGTAMRLAKDARATGRWDRALEFVRWASSLDPLNEAIQVELITLLGSRGDAAGARRAYQTFADRMERELGGAPSAATRQALARAESVMPSTGPLVEELPLLPPQPAAALPEAPRVSRARWRPWVPIVGVLTLGVALAALFLNRDSGRSSSIPILAVAPIHQLPARSDSAEVLPIADLLATSLGRLPSMQVLSGARLIEIEQSLARNGNQPAPTEIARRAQATELLEGTVYRIGADSLVLELRRVDVRSGTVLHGYRVGARDVFTLVDRATSEIARAADVPLPVKGIADVTTRSLIAFRFYQEGLRSYYGHDLSAARRLFQSAVGEDSTFAMAMWYLARTEASLESPAVWGRYLAALRLATGASDRERLLITADFLLGDGRATARVVAETLATRYPIDPEGLWLLGRAASAASDYAGAVTTLRRAIALDSALEPQPGPSCRLCEAYETLTQVYTEADSTGTARAVAEEYVRRMPNSPRAWALLITVAQSQADAAAVLAAEAEYDRLVPDANAAAISAATLRLLWKGEYDRALERMLSVGSVQPALRGAARWWALIALRNLGRLRDALDLARGQVRHTGAMAVLNLPADSLNLALIRFEQGFPGACAEYFQSRPWSLYGRALGKEWPGQAAREEVWALGRVAMCRAAQRDTAALAAIADTVQKLGAISGYGRDQRLHHYVRGLLWKARGDQPRAVAEFRAAISSPNYGFTRINSELAGSLLSLGRPLEAVAILQAALRGALDASNLYLTRTEIHERLAQAWDAAGQRDSARIHWAEVDRAWQRADSAFFPRWQIAHRHAGTNRRGS